MGTETEIKYTNCDFYLGTDVEVHPADLAEFLKKAAGKKVVGATKEEGGQHYLFLKIV